MQFNLEIKEVLRKTFSVEADSLDDAVDKLEQAYFHGEVILTADDYYDYMIGEIKDNEN